MARMDSRVEVFQSFVHQMLLNRCVRVEGGELTPSQRTHLSKYFKQTRKGKPPAKNLLRGVLNQMGVEAWSIEYEHYSGDMKRDYTRAVRECTQLQNRATDATVSKAAKVSKSQRYQKYEAAEKTFLQKRLDKNARAALRLGTKKTVVAMRDAVVEEIFKGAPGELRAYVGAFLSSDHGQALFAFFLAAGLSKLPLNKVPLLPESVGDYLEENKEFIIDELEVSSWEHAQTKIVELLGGAMAKVAPMLPAFFGRETAQLPISAGASS